MTGNPSHPRILVRSRIQVSFLAVGLILTAPVFGGLPPPPESVEELTHYMNHCIASGDLDCLMSIVESSSAVDEVERKNIRDQWHRCLSDGGAMAYNNVDFDLSYFVDREERDGLIYSLPMEPIGLVNMTCNYGSYTASTISYTVSTIHWVGNESGRYFVMCWRVEPIQIDPKELQRLLIAESEQTWEKFSWIEEKVREVYPRHETEYYRSTIEETALDLMGNGYIEVFRMQSQSFPTRINVRDEKLTPRRAQELLQEESAWVSNSEDEDGWSVWYRATQKGVETFDDLDPKN